MSHSNGHASANGHGKTLNLTLHIWRQSGPDAPGRMVPYKLEGVSTDCSFLEMLDLLNEQLILKGEDPIAFEHDCREGICGCCGVVINGHPHGPEQTTTCQLHMRSFQDGAELYIEPWRAKAFPVIKDLVVDRSAFDRIIQAGGYISTNTGSAPEANSILVKKEEAEAAFNAATCIGCGACVAACPNASAMLFVAAKVAHFAHLPQGQIESSRRARAMVAQMDQEGFGNCTNHGECEAACPKGISLDNIVLLNREYLKASLATAGT